MREIIDGLTRTPRTCTWELTLRCNLSCGHCGSSAGRPRPGEMPRETALRVVAELAALGCRRLTLSGGEPTLSEHWEQVASEGARLGMSVNMITNGLAGGRELVRRARDAGRVSLGVSLDGLEREHDRVRRSRGLFGRAMQLLDDCAAEKMPVGVITTITRANMRDLGSIHDLVAGRVYTWQVQIGAAMGNLRERRDEQIAPEDLLEIVPTLARLAQRGVVDVRVADNVGYFGPYEKVLRRSRRSPLDHWIGCYAGCRHLGIEADGGVKGCLSIQASSATEGNLNVESLADIWSKPGAFAYNRAFTLDDLGGFCRTCLHAAVCRGGCLSMRTCEGGRDNPFCYHRVATLAEREARRRQPRYVPIAVVPAAVLGIFGLGCGGSAVTEQTQRGSTCPPDCASAQDGGTDAAADSRDGGPEAEGSPWAPAYGLPYDAPPEGSFPVDVYGIPPPDAPPMADAYGIQPPDAKQDGPQVKDAYGLPPPDAEEDVVDHYGLPPPDAGNDMVDFYGMPPPP
jgi:radical SAM protein with 4Fe4S-binding SPASM domain